MGLPFREIGDLLGKSTGAVQKMAYRARLINPEIQPAPQELQDKHYLRKHGPNAYYGQKK